MKIISNSYFLARRGTLFVGAWGIHTSDRYLDSWNVTQRLYLLELYLTCCLLRTIVFNSRWLCCTLLFLGCVMMPEEYDLLGRLHSFFLGDQKWRLLMSEEIGKLSQWVRGMKRGSFDMECGCGSFKSLGGLVRLVQGRVEGTSTKTVRELGLLKRELVICPL